MLGEKLRDLGYGVDIYPEAKYYAVKMPVFSFEKLTDVDTNLGPEMKSTGECLGLAETFPQALLKAFKGASMKVPRKGSKVILTVKDQDKEEVAELAKEMVELGMELYATSGTHAYLSQRNVQVKLVERLGNAHPNIEDMIQSGVVDMILNTPRRTQREDGDGWKIRRSAVEHSVLCLTSTDTCRAILTARKAGHSDQITPVDITTI